MPYVLPFVALLSSIIGTEDEPNYDSLVTLPPAVSEAAVFIRGVLEDYAHRGRRLWPFVPSSLCAAFLAEKTGSAHIASITWDASLYGWGAVFRWWDNREGLTLVGSLPDSLNMTFQVRRETMAGLLSLAAAARVVDLSNAVIILRNDAVGALAALSKGSFKSTFLQQCALLMSRLERRIGCESLHLHAPGRALIDKGIDNLSCDTALEVTGPVSSPDLRLRAHTLASSLGWTITVDAFATATNAVTPRFFARFAEPDAEAEDAFTVLDWNSSQCPSCGLIHREVIFAYPPPPTTQLFRCQGRADGIRALILTPLAVSAPYWNNLLRASIIPGDDGFLRFRHTQSAEPNTAAAEDLALFAVDFASSASPRHASPWVPSCGSDTAFRGRPLLGSLHDQAERARIHLELHAVNLALKP